MTPCGTGVSPAMCHFLQWIIEMKKAVFFVSLFFAGLCFDAQAQTDDIIPSGTLLSQAAAADKHDAALKYISVRKPADLPEMVGDFLLSGSDQAEKERVIVILQKYPHQVAMKVYLRVLDKTASFMVKKQLIDFLGRTGDRGIVIPVSKELSSPFSAVRESAILALKELGDDRMFPAIFAMSENKDPVYRIYALESLYHLYDLRLFSIVQKLIADENKAVRLLAVKCVERNSLDKLLPVIRSLALSDPNDEVRLQAVVTIGKMNDAGGLNVLLKLCSAENRDLRFTTVKVLSKFRNRQAAYVMSEQLAAENDNEIKMLILDSLIDMRDAGGYRGMEKMLSDQVVSLRVRAAYGLGLIGGQKGLQILFKSVKDSDYRVRAESCNSLGNFKDKGVAQTLNGVVKGDADRFVRLAALYSLDRLREKSAIIPLFDQYAVEKDPVFKMKLFEITRVLIQYSI